MGHNFTWRSGKAWIMRWSQPQDPSGEELSRQTEQGGQKRTGGWLEEVEQVQGREEAGVAELRTKVQCRLR